MLHVAFYGCDEVGQEVVAFFEECIGGCEDVFDLVSSADEGVEHEDWDEKYYRYNDYCRPHVQLPGLRDNRAVIMFDFGGIQ